MSTYLGTLAVSIKQVSYRNHNTVDLLAKGTSVLNNVFDPVTLFAGGKQGVWYDPSDKSTLFQDVAGRVPVTKDGDPVALILDKSQGAKTEYLYNKSVIDSLDGWYSREDRTNGNMILTPEGIRAEIGIGGFGTFPQDNFIAVDLVLKKGVTYFFNALVDSSALNGGPYLRLFDSNNEAVFTLSVLQNNPQQAFTPEKDMNVSCQVRSTSYRVQGVLILKSLVIKAVAGNHATQSVSTARPIYKTDGILHWLQFDGVDDFFVFNYPMPQTELWLGMEMTNTMNMYLMDMREFVTAYYYGVSGANDNKSGNIEYLTPTAFKDRAKVFGLNLNFNSSKSFFMARYSLDGYGRGRLFSYIRVAGSLTSDTRLGIKTYLAAKAGVTL